MGVKMMTASIETTIAVVLSVRGVSVQAQGEITMPAVAVRKHAVVQEFGPRSAGVRMSLREFDHANFVEGYRYELINGVLVVSPIPLPQERGPNELLGYFLLSYRRN